MQANLSNVQKVPNSEDEKYVPQNISDVNVEVIKLREKKFTKKKCIKYSIIVL